MTRTGGISRRELLAGIGVAGAAIGSSAVGHSTASALLNDASQFAGNVATTGEVDLSIAYDAYYTDSSDGSTTSTSETIDGDAVGGLEIPDISPGDQGRVVFCPALTGNPSYLWLCGGVTKNAENGKPDPEGGETEPGQGDEPADGPKGELDDAIQARLTYLSSRDGSGDSVVLREGTFGQVLEMLQYGIPLDAAPNYDATGYREFAGPGEQTSFTAGTEGQPCLELTWWVPGNVNNNIISDQLEFEFVFHAYQARHTAGTLNTCVTQKGISFVSFCVEEGTNFSDSDVSFVIHERDSEDEPVAIEWQSDVPLRTVVLKYAGIFENFYVDGATSGVATVGAGDVRLAYDPKDSPALENGQSPKDPCPEGETGYKYEYEGGAFTLDS